MKLSDIMSHAGLSLYAEVALVLFLFAFVVQAVRTFAPSRAALLEQVGRLPLDDPNDRLGALAPGAGAHRE